MRVAPLTAGLLISSILAAGAIAQPKPPPHEVSGVTIYPARGHPKVTATFPAAGQAIAGGVLILTVTFDQEMSPSGFDLEPAAGGEAPPCLKIPRLLDDGKTFAWLCTTRPGKSYQLQLNAADHGGFTNLAEERAEPNTLAFTTTSAPDGPSNIRDAVKLAGLKAFEIPVQETPGLPANP
jgi:hypothetical protein